MVVDMVNINNHQEGMWSVTHVASLAIMKMNVIIVNIPMENFMGDIKVIM